MARPKSEDKDNAILEAATAVFAERGFWSTPTSAISKAAGIAEGTLFTYYRTKDDLLNKLYRTLKEELAGALLAGIPPKAGLETAVRRVWENYFRWALANPDKYKVACQLRVSDRLTEESKAAGARHFAALETMLEEEIRRKRFRDLPFEFLAALMGGLMDATIAHAAGHPRAKREICAQGFEVLWRGLGRA